MHYFTASLSYYKESSKYMDILNKKYPYTDENKFILSYQFMTFVDKSDKTPKLLVSLYKKYLKYKNKYLTLMKKINI